MVTNPSGTGGSTAGWNLAHGGTGATLNSVTYAGGSAVEWQIQGNLGHPDWVWYYPAVQNGKTYTFSVEVAGNGQAFLDVWNGTKDVFT
ncbi:MAG: hypothetical protein ACYCOU_24330 [Sulfobacillus sp.]